MFYACQNAGCKRGFDKLFALSQHQRYCNHRSEEERQKRMGASQTTTDDNRNRCYKVGCSRAFTNVDLAEKHKVRCNIWDENQRLARTIWGWDYDNDGVPCKNPGCTRLFENADGVCLHQITCNRRRPEERIAQNSKHWGAKTIGAGVYCDHRDRGCVAKFPVSKKRRTQDHSKLCPFNPATGFILTPDRQILCLFHARGCKRSWTFSRARGVTKHVNNCHFKTQLPNEEPPSTSDDEEAIPTSEEEKDDEQNPSGSTPTIGSFAAAQALTLTESTATSSTTATRLAKWAASGSPPGHAPTLTKKVATSSLITHVPTTTATMVPATTPS
ncbi:hypothetical protein QBC38DRAFT_461248 [Podospora fimiseda]|uniref:C2H2-type domain-containing protein n=1 Tax=Podospora fimiseda TaxID=252190 RepID=A0AAN6YPN8_9PEZI|nr:hypothetical protein QBC38DRAFT_461248 [Podospora fimiseda]